MDWGASLIATDIRNFAMPEPFADKTLLPEQTILLAGTAAAWLGTYGLLGPRPINHTTTTLLCLQS